MATLTLKEVPLDQLHPNPWNPNRPSSRVRAAIRESMELYGYVDPVTVRPVEDGWEIVDGEHRYHEALALGMDTLAVVPLELTDEEAKKLTIILNETRGDADLVELSFLLRELDLPRDQLILGLPYTDGQLDSLLELASTNWRDELDHNADAALEKWSHMKVALPPGVEPIVIQAMDRYYTDRERDARPEVAAGLWIEALAADFLAGP